MLEVAQREGARRRQATFMENSSNAHRHAFHRQRATYLIEKRESRDFAALTRDYRRQAICHAGPDSRRRRDAVRSMAVC